MADEMRAWVLAQVVAPFKQAIGLLNTKINANSARIDTLTSRFDTNESQLSEVIKATAARAAADAGVAVRFSARLGCLRMSVWNITQT